jgi:hypothetical protein
MFAENKQKLMGITQAQRMRASRHAQFSGKRTRIFVEVPCELSSAKHFD